MRLSADSQPAGVVRRGRVLHDQGVRAAHRPGQGRQRREAAVAGDDAATARRGVRVVVRSQGASRAVDTV